MLRRAGINGSLQCRGIQVARHQERLTACILQSKGIGRTLRVQALTIRMMALSDARRPASVRRSHAGASIAARLRSSIAVVTRVQSGDLVAYVADGEDSMSDLRPDLSPNMIEAAPPQPFSVRPALRKDIAAIADLLLEGFGHEYGGVLLHRTGRRFMERVHALPGRLNGMAVAIDLQDQPVGVAGLRTRELRLRLDGGEQQIMFEELGVGSSIWLDLRESLMAPPPYQPGNSEAYLYSISVTQRWRGRGVGDALLEFLHGQARDLAKAAALLEVVETNLPARRLYARHGYSLLRRRRGPLGWIPRFTPPLLLLHKPL